MSLQTTFSNTFHLREFVDTVTDDPSRDNASNYVEIHPYANIFEESSFYNPNVNGPLCVKRLLLCRWSLLYYLVTDGPLEISVQETCLTLTSIDNTCRNSGVPMVTIIDFVPPRSDKTLDLSEHRCFAVETPVYDTSKPVPVAFSVACFLENTKRWQKVKIPPSGAFLSITAKVAGRTIDTNQLALRALDPAYLPRPAAVPMATPTPSSTPTSKRSERWVGRAPPSTPSKRQRGSEDVSASGNSYRKPLLQPTEGWSHVSISENSPDSPVNSPFHSSSPPTTANTDESSII
ncbi:uncharacterized protein FMAN_14188 [Fusarium mangiferae]|uniref:Uncharacterized protein n=1 Tax=Fusarium mangiferae TaxID=192010 RepID=A0A1L7UBR4_FUSMA|nr:uncharacterized protein FMAN_14188 [Fusarium mangiferae]CVL08150.1 uncharacterized protein FMAN_14188 [Fusarium mangiferae]